MQHAEKIVFAHILRGFAALIVLIGHLFYTFWMLPGISTMLGAPVLEPIPNAFTTLVDRFLMPGAMGHFGVALFFLISGFVIPFSLLNRSRLQFAIARILRLWPTYAAGLSITVLFIMACSAWFGQSLPFKWSTYIYQLLFVRDLVWVQSIDGIVWTLEIEAKFYLIMAIFAPALRHGKLGPLAGAAVVLMLIAIAASNLPGWITSGAPYYSVLYGLTLSGQMICYMMIGVVFNFFHRGLVSVRYGCTLIVFFFVTFAIQWPLGPIRVSSFSGVVTYGAALAVFASAFLLRDRIRAPRSLSWLADISYPLYVIHGFAGYALMRVLYDLGVGVFSCIAAAVVFSFAAAQALHLLVEKPSQAMARRIGSGTKFKSLRSALNSRYVEN